MLCQGRASLRGDAGEVFAQVLPLVAEWRPFLEGSGSSGGQMAYTMWTGARESLPTVLMMGQELLDAPNPEIAEASEAIPLGTAAVSEDWNDACERGVEDILELETALRRRRVQGWRRCDGGRPRPARRVAHLDTCR